MYRRQLNIAALVLLLAGGVPNAAISQQQTQKVSRPHSIKPPQFLQEHARDALKSGKLRPWQALWYNRLAAGYPVKPVTVWATQYGLWDTQKYKGETYHIACNKLPRGTVVWLEATKRLHVVTNRGADSNDFVAREKKHAAYWVDCWTKYEGQYGWSTTNSRMWIVGFASGW